MDLVQLPEGAQRQRTIPAEAVQSGAWERFVGSSPQATIFHHRDWARLLTDTYGFQPRVLVQTDGQGRVEAGALFLDVRSRLTGHRLVSVPFTDHTPVLARDDRARRQFAEGLVAWRRQERLPRLEVHGELPETAGVHPVQEGVRHLLELGTSPDDLYRSLKGTQTGRAIRKAERSGVTVRMDTSPAGVAAYYRLHVLTRRRQGVPVQPSRFFDLLWSHLIDEDHGFVALAEHAGEPVAGAVFLGWNGCLIYKYGASDDRSWDVRPNNLLFWKVMERACEQGYRVLDFGKTDLYNHGLREFKRRWGATEVPLQYSKIDDGPVRQADRGRASMVMASVISHSPPVIGRLAGELLYRHFA